jgi:WD40 repeat protein
VPVLAAGLVASLALAAWLAFRPAPVLPTYRQVTFERGPVSGARFAPDGESILYSISKNNGLRVHSSSLFSPGSREIPGAVGALVSVSRNGEMALLRASGLTPLGGSTLWRMPINGGGAVETERNVFSADWSPRQPDQIAIARAVQGECRLEFPPGQVLFRTPGYITDVRFSPGGYLIAFVHHPARHDEAGQVMVADMDGNLNHLSKGWASVAGLAWNSPQEVGSGRRSLDRCAASWSSVKDISADGSVLLFEENATEWVARR